jgi:hypothetical protein
MKLLRLSIYVLIILAIAKFSSGNNAQIPEPASYSNTFSFKPTPQIEHIKLQGVINQDSVIYLNLYSNMPLNQKPMYIKSNHETSSRLTRIYQSSEQQNRKSDLNFSFIVF